jgi:hypothetical protein
MDDTKSVLSFNENSQTNGEICSLSILLYKGLRFSVYCTDKRRGRELYKSRISTETQFTAKTTIKESCGPQIQEMTAAIEHQVHAGKKYLRLCTMYARNYQPQRKCLNSANDFLSTSAKPLVVNKHNCCNDAKPDGNSRIRKCTSILSPAPQATIAQTQSIETHDYTYKRNIV